MEDSGKMWKKSREKEFYNFRMKRKPCGIFWKYTYYLMQNNNIQVLLL
jgi:hypothetical protein